MSMYTTGPWRWIRARTLQHLHGPRKGYLGVSMPLAGRHDLARLIAAAPELLEALTEMTELAAGPVGGVSQQQKRDVLAKARAAITKATGESA